MNGAIEDAGKLAVLTRLVFVPLPPVRAFAKQRHRADDWPVEEPHSAGLGCVAALVGHQLGERNAAVGTDGRATHRIAESPPAHADWLRCRGRGHALLGQQGGGVRPSDGDQVGRQSHAVIPPEGPAAVGIPAMIRDDSDFGPFALTAAATQNAKSHGRAE